VSDQPVGIGSYVVYVQFVKGQPEAAIKGAAKDMDKARRPMEESGKKLGASWKKSFAASIAIGAVLLNEVNKLQSGFNQIRVATGATGKQFDALKKSATNVFSDVSGSFAQVGGVIGELNTRLGLTGEALEGVAKTTLDLSALTGTDAVASVNQLSQTINDWGLSSGNATEIMDQLFRATQASGIGYDQLNSTLIKSGSTLRQLGFEFEDAVALIAVMEKNGVNANEVFAGLKRNLANTAKEGEPLAGAFLRVSNEIKNATTETEALNIATKAFGSRSAVELTDAIRAGRLEYGQMLATIKTGKDTIASARADTRTLSDTFGELRNKLTAAVTPALSTLGESLIVANNTLAGLPTTVVGASAAMAGLAVVMRKLSVAIRTSDSNMRVFLRTTQGKAFAIGTAAVAVVSLQEALFGYIQASQRAEAQGLIGNITEDVNNFVEAAKASNEIGRNLGSYDDAIISAGLSVESLAEKQELFNIETEESIFTLDGLKKAVLDIPGIGKAIEYNLLGGDRQEVQVAIENLEKYDDALATLAATDPSRASELLEGLRKQFREAGLSSEEFNKIMDRTPEVIRGSLTELTKMPQLLDLTVSEQDALNQVEREFGRTLEKNTDLMKQWTQATASAFDPVRRLIGAQDAVLDAKLRLLDIEGQIRALESEVFEGEQIDFLKKGESLFEAENRRNKETQDQNQKRLEFEKTIAERRASLEREIAEVNKGNIDRAFNVINSQKQLASVLGPLVAEGKSGIEALDVVIAELKQAGVSEQDLQAFRDQSIPLLEQAERNAIDWNTAFDAETNAMKARIEEIQEISRVAQEAFIAEVNSRYKTLDDKTSESYLNYLTTVEGMPTEMADAYVQGYINSRKTMLQLAAMSPMSEGGSEITEREKKIIDEEFGANYTFSQAEGLIKRGGNLDPVTGMPSGEGFADWNKSQKSTNDLIAEAAIRVGASLVTPPLVTAYKGIRAAADFFFRANGGNVNPSRQYVVGERGPELFVPSQSGYIMSNRDLMSGMAGGGITNVFQTRELSAAQLADEVSFRQARQLNGRQR
jgi:hypothetical protein